jgi:hypothetical protein
MKYTVPMSNICIGYKLEKNQAYVVEAMMENKY